MWNLIQCQFQIKKPFRNEIRNEIKRLLDKGVSKQAENFDGEYISNVFTRARKMRYLE